YMVDGREYVVLAFGGNETARGNSNLQTSAPGDALIAFALPQGSASAAAGAATPEAGAAKPNVVAADMKDVPLAGRFTGKQMAPAKNPPAGSTVYEVQFHDQLYFPNQITVKPGEQVAIHLMNVGKSGSTGFAIDLPAGEIAMAGQLSTGHDAYISFTAPKDPGVYQFYYPAESKRFRGSAGYVRVALPGEATTPGMPATSAPTANPGNTRIPGTTVGSATPAPGSPQD
ncbi:MAG TPA: hypothetical protein VFI22_19395, partial [Thermomicrobiales bacterium]|nr:hypothetical protein [Thermomicrobiales bacterium]